MNKTEFVRLDINSEETLRNILTNQFPEIKTDSWVKNVSALYKEIKKGECVLGIQDEKLHRRVDTVSIQCFYTDENNRRSQIFEEKQIFTNGITRERGFKFVAEKLKFGETHEHAALRGLRQELGIFGDDISVTALPQENTFKIKESPSYLGIDSSYTDYMFFSEIPKAHYKDSYVESKGDKDTYFIWIKV